MFQTGQLVVHLPQCSQTFFQVKEFDFVMVDLILMENLRYRKHEKTCSTSTTFIVTETKSEQ